ncbi:MAG: enoyl-CoA hydratase/isomerase family protein [Candidatus Tectomicrobia bacterium]|uniref:Enoyl-CoA hydratase/isomerase family protein n=1 Tax=Tectimicrobiota bacterium TaxID=2528274 RepID=A0A932CMY4_UNCTE|nr:enoyl-CoA hydratase/isomerase family protein [Candidatus Tectomicrobia bacterium]
MMEFQNILYQVENHVLTITLNRPRVRNALSRELLQDLRDGLEAAEKDEEVRAIVITGAGEAFCSGGDLTQLARMIEAKTAEEYVEQNNPFVEAILTVYQLGKPVIAAVNGPAVGGGCELSLSCDLRIASEKAVFAELFVRLGDIPGLGGLFFLPRIVGLGKAYELAYTGQAVPAEEAYRIGLVNHLVPSEKFPGFVRDFAEMLAKGPTKAIGYIKKGIQYSLNSDLQASFEQLKEYQKILKDTWDNKEGILSALEKRRAVFRGK